MRSGLRRVCFLEHVGESARESRVVDFLTTQEQLGWRIFTSGTLCQGCEKNIACPVVRFLSGV